MRAMSPTGDILPAQLGWNRARENGHSTNLLPLRQHGVLSGAACRVSGSAWEHHRTCRWA